MNAETGDRGVSWLLLCKRCLCCLQVLPFATDETLTRLESNLGLMPAVSDLMAMNFPLEKVRDMILDGIGVDDSVQSEIVPTFGPCSKDELTVRHQCNIFYETLAPCHCEWCHITFLQPFKSHPTRYSCDIACPFWFRWPLSILQGSRSRCSWEKE